MLSIIEQLPLFSGLTEQEKSDLLKGGRVRQIPKGQMIFAHGDELRYFYIIGDGIVQLFRGTADGQEKTIEILIAGNTIGEMEIFESFPNYQANAVAVDDVAVMEFPIAWLKESARKYSAFTLNLLSAISRNASLAKVEAEHHANMSAAQLVACFLQRLCILHDLDPKGFDLPYSKTLISSRLGIELETFSRTLSKLKDHGIVVKGNRVTICDQGKIDEYVCSHCSIVEDCPTHREMEKRMRSK